MPQFGAVLTPAEIESRGKGGRAPVDLTSYVDYLARIEPNHGGQIILGENEKKSTVKRHLNAAAKKYKVPLRFFRSGEQELVFQLLPADTPPSPQRGGRRKKTEV